MAFVTKSNEEFPREDVPTGNKTGDLAVPVPMAKMITCCKCEHSAVECNENGPGYTIKRERYSGRL